MVMVVSWYIKGTLLDTTNRSFVSTVTLFLFLFSTNKKDQDVIMLRIIRGTEG